MLGLIVDQQDYCHHYKDAKPNHKSYFIHYHTCLAEILYEFISNHNCNETSTMSNLSITGMMGDAITNYTMNHDD